MPPGIVGLRTRSSPTKYGGILPLYFYSGERGSGAATGWENISGQATQLDGANWGPLVHAISSLTANLLSTHIHSKPVYDKCLSVLEFS